jgi:GxxExxY protein
MRQVRLPVNYKGVALQTSLRLDLLVGNKVVIEVKATENNHSLHKAQVLTYLRLSGLRLGLVLNFGQERLIDGFSRVVNGL